MSFLGRRYFKLPILSCPRIPPATQANCESNKATTKKICLKGPKLCTAKGMALVIQCLHFSNKYVIC